MNLSSRNIEGKYHNSYFDNGVWVGIIPEDKTWEYQDSDDEETYISGSFTVEGKTVIDYDGCYELPAEVVMALATEYDIDL